MGAYPDPAGGSRAVAGGSYGHYFTDNGLLLANQTTNITSCTDGTSSTIIVAEQSAFVGTGTPTATTDKRSHYWSAWGGCTGSAATPWIVQKLVANPPTTPPDWYGNGATAVRYKINATPAGAGANYPYMTNTILNSYHTGGINVVFADGSVRYLSEGADLVTVLQPLCTRDDGITVSNY